MVDDMDPEAVRVAVEHAQRNLDAERAEYDRQESRAGTISATTGGFVAAIGVIVAFASGTQRPYTFSILGLILLIVASMFFLAAVVIAQFAVLYGRAGELAPDDSRQPGLGDNLQEALMKSWAGYRATASGYGRATQSRRSALGLAVASQMLAIIFLAATVITILVQSIR